MPRLLSTRPIDATVMPLPTLETTPPVTNMYLTMTPPDFGFWILDFGFQNYTNAIQNPKPKIQNRAKRLVPGLFSSGLRRRLHRLLCAGCRPYYQGSAGCCQARRLPYRPRCGCPGD